LKKMLNLLTKLLILLFYIFTWSLVENNSNNLNKGLMYFYLLLFVASLVSDRYFYSGQKSQDNKKYEITSWLIYITWFCSLIVPLLEHVYFKRENIFLTIIGAVLVVTGIAIRGIGIKTLGKYFSRDVETWDNHVIVKTGIYKYIRHPAYAGNIMQLIGFPLVLNSYFCLILSFITIACYMWRIIVEEKFLSSKIPEYKDYMKETYRIIPKVW